MLRVDVFDALDAAEQLFRCADHFFALRARIRHARSIVSNGADFPIELGAVDLLRLTRRGRKTPQTLLVLATERNVKITVALIQYLWFGIMLPKVISNIKNVDVVLSGIRSLRFNP